MSGFVVVEGAVIKCSASATPSTISLLAPSVLQINNRSICSITDHLPIVNIKPCGVCSITSLPCVPITLAPWISDLTSRFGLSIPITANSTLVCAVGGVISIQNTLQTTVSLGVDRLRKQLIGPMPVRKLEPLAKSKKSAARKAGDRSVDQNKYRGRYLGEYPEAGGSLCSAGATTMALQYFPGNEDVTFDDIADRFIANKPLMVNVGQIPGQVLGLIDGGETVANFLNANSEQYHVKAEYQSMGFDEGWLKGKVAGGSVVVVNVPGHFVTVAGYRENEGKSEFYIDDSNRGYWGSDTRAVLDKGWVSSQELESLTYNNVVVISGN